MKKFILGLICSLSLTVSAQADVLDKVDQSIYAIEDLMQANETSIPMDLLRASTCIATVRIFQAAF